MFALIKKQIIMSDQRAAAERLGNQKSANQQQEQEEEMTTTTPMRRVLTVQIRNEEEATQKSVLEIVEKVFVSVLETSEIRAYDVTVTKENDDKEKITYTYKAPAPSFPFVPRSIGRLSETGVCEVTEVVVCDYEKNKLENFCETKGMLFADMFVVESFVGLQKISGNSRAVVCVVDVRLRWLKRLDTQRWMEGLVTKATEMKIRKKYEIDEASGERVECDGDDDEKRFKERFRIYSAPKRELSLLRFSFDFDFLLGLLPRWN